MLESLFKAAHNTALGEWLRGAVWHVPVFEFVHIIGIVLLMGSVLIINLRLFGLLLRQQPIAQLAADLAGFQKLGLVLILLSGPVLFTASAAKFYMTDSFWWKMGFLVLALLFQFTAHRNFVNKNAPAPGITGPTMAAISLFLWFSVLLNGMWTLLS